MVVVAQTVGDNNAFLLGKNLLTEYRNLETYRREQQLGNVKAVQEAMFAALKTHHDPPMFIINALLTVGTFVGFKNLDPDFELEISEFLVAVLQRCVQWRQDHPEEWAAAIAATVTSSAPPAGPSSSVAHSSPVGFYFDEKSPVLGNSKVEDDLIVLDEDQAVFGRPSLSAASAASHPLRVQHTGSSVVSLLDKDEDGPSMSHMVALKPSFADLIDLSNFDSLDRCASSVSTMSTATEITPPMSECSFGGIATAGDEVGDRQTDDGENEPDDVVLQVDLQLLDKANRFVTELDLQQPGHGQGQGRRRSEIESDMEELLKVFDTQLDAEKDKDKDDSMGVNIERITSPRHEDQSARTLIQQEHRVKLLEEVLGGKNSLQVYSAIKVLNMQPHLMQPAKEGEETYGWMLARQLYSKGRFREASVMVFEYLKPRNNSVSDPSSPLPSSPSPSTPLPVSLSRTSTTTGGTSRGGNVQGSSSQPGLHKISSFPSPFSSQTSSPRVMAAKTKVAQTPTFELPLHTRVVFVDSDTQVEELSHALRSSRAVGMDTEWLPQIEAYAGIQPTAARTAILQLACDRDSTVYIVDTVAFLESDDYGMALVEIIGEFFNAQRTLKLAYDWDGDQDLLLATYPALFQEKYRPRNFLDLKYLWFKVADETNDIDSDNNDNSNNSDNNDSSDIKETTSQASSSSSASSPMVGGGYDAWSMFPSVPGMRQIPGGLSGMLSRLCGKKLDKSQQCSHWEQRPLSQAQQVYAAVDAWCLLDIYEVLDKIERI
ncbi:Exonuclease mut-7 [Dissophora ornata]|nr:Exonuclease mut-7 [Dissophora ornata]